MPVFYKRNAHLGNQRLATDLCDRRTVTGCLVNVRYVPSSSWWFETTTGLLKESMCTTGSSKIETSHTGLDDMLFSGGHTFFLDKERQLGMYGLVGLPTKSSVSRHESPGPLVGSRFYSVGGGLEISNSFRNNAYSDLICIAQLRVVHFFSRTWEPILPQGGKIQPGQTIDILLSLRYRQNRTLFEGGYNPTFFINQTLILPTEIVPTETIVRQGGYISFTHLTEQKPFGKPLVLAAGFTGTYTQKLSARAYSMWFNITLIF